MFGLFEYQSAIVQETIAHMLEGGAPCLESPTGSGKTVMLAEIARCFRAWDYEVLLAAHRNPIIEQLADSCSKHTGERIGFLSRARTTADAGIVVTMMPTLARRPKVVPRYRGRVLLVDEAHHISAKTYQRIIRELRPAFFAGASATPVTPTGEGLGRWGITKLIQGPSMRRLINDGKLCDYDLYAGNTIVDTTGVPLSRGDLSPGELEKRIVEVDGDFVRDLQEFNPTLEPTIAVTVSVNHAQELVSQYREAGITAEIVYDKTPDKLRKKIFETFRQRKLQVIVSVSLIDEGLDLPEAVCLQLIRPTRSIRLWRQLIGRVLRTDKNNPGKRAIIIDHGNCFLTLQVPDYPIDWTLEGKIRILPPKVAIGRDNRVTVIERATGPLVASGNKRELKKIDTRSLMEKALDSRRKAARKNLYLVKYKSFNPSILWPYANNADGLGDAELRQIETCLGLPPGYCKPTSVIGR